MRNREIPVYLFTGFLESGKTRFIQGTLEDERFNTGEKAEDPVEAEAPNV